ncbi:MAG: T9SS type A sorting domain-containing protein [Candidatus Fibromonas sp.]|jgi:hypothetical protein|nr:T9SS type A sorting domain-containing protein [Candidatus Fibromonas sp.]
MAQKLSIFVLTLLLGSFTANADWLSRYWDGCKPSCSWTGKPTAAGMGQCKECNKQDQLMTTSDQNRSACDGGTAYTCWDMSPVAQSTTLAYGFVASNPSKMSCGSCYELTFTGEGQHGTGPSHRALQGKKMIVMASNIGGDVANDQFDLLVPGGGVGAFDAFSNQIGKNKSDLGSQYGGFLDQCPNNNLASVEANQSCIKTKCASVFAGKDKLKAGCDFYADWLMGANNPKFTSRSIDCPDYLKTAYKGAAGNPPGGGGGSSSSVVPPSTYTLTVTRNPTAGGTTTPAASQANISAGTPVNITATASNGYTFQNWTAVSGTPTFNNPNSANTSVTLYVNATIRANFTQNSGGGSSSGSSNPSSSSSMAGGIGNCIQPPGQVEPPNGIETCIAVGGKCYKCNQARGTECLNTWLWDGLQVTSDWWFTQVTCPSTGGGQSSSSRAATASSSSRATSSSSGGVVPILPQASAYINGAYIQANGIYLQVEYNAKLELFDLRGNSVKKMNFPNGIHSVQLNNLPKGLYIAKISFGSERKILRIPVR